MVTLHLERQQASDLLNDVFLAHSKYRENVDLLKQVKANASVGEKAVYQELIDTFEKQMAASEIVIDKLQEAGV